MTKYLISFPSEAMMVSDEELPDVAAAAHAVIEEAKAAGVYVFGGGIHEGVDPVLVSGDVYDRAVPAVSSVRLLDRALARLAGKPGTSSEDIDILIVVASCGAHTSGITKCSHSWLSHDPTRAS